MAVTQVTTAPDLATYRKIADTLHLAEDPPAGLILHAVSVIDSGEVQIIDIYETREQLQAFAPERLFPAAESIGMVDVLTQQGPPTAYDAIELLVVK